MPLPPQRDKNLIVDSSLSNKNMNCNKIFYWGVAFASISWILPTLSRIAIQFGVIKSVYLPLILLVISLLSAVCSAIAAGIGLFKRTRIILNLIIMLLMLLTVLGFSASLGFMIIFISSAG